MKKLIFVLITVLLFKLTLYSQYGWYKLNSPSNEKLNSFWIGYMGLIGGNNGTLLWSTDSGINWVYYKITEKNINAAYFSYMFNTFAFCDAGGVCRSTNLGTNWTFGQINSTENLTSVVALSTRIFVSGDMGRLYYSSNEGLSWNYNQVYNKSLRCLSKIYSIGIVVGDSGAVFRSTNNGSNWSKINAFTSLNLNFVTYATDGNFYACGDNGLVLKGLYDGTQWATINTGVNIKLRSISAFENIIYFCGDNGKIYKSSTYGQFWSQQISGVTTNLNYIKFINQTTGWAVGDNGIILRTTNGGDPIGIEPISNEIPNEYKLFQNYPNPFNPISNIKYQIPSNVKGEMSNVKLAIYDILGREISVLVNQNQKAGTYEIQFNGTNYPSGVYFYELSINNPDGTTSSGMNNQSPIDYSETKKMLMIK